MKEVFMKFKIYSSQNQMLLFICFNFIIVMIEYGHYCKLLIFSICVVVLVTINLKYKIIIDIITKRKNNLMEKLFFKFDFLYKLIYYCMYITSTF